MREFPHHPRCPRSLCLPLRYAHLPVGRSSCVRMAQGPFSTEAVLYGLAYRLVQHSYTLRCSHTYLNPVPHPHGQAYRHARSVNGGAVLHVVTAPPGDCRCACRLDWSHRDGEHLGRPYGPGSLSRLPRGSNREQAFRPEIHKILPPPLTSPPARLNHAA